MTEIERSLLDTLLELENQVRAGRTGNPKFNLIPLFQQIDRLAEALPKDADPSLMHYLRKKSYEKARLFLQGRDAENRLGNCRHSG